MSIAEIRALSAPERRRKRGVITMAGLGSFALVIFGLLPKSGQPVTYSFVLGSEWVLAKEIIVNSKSGALLFSVIALLAVAMAALQFRGRKTIRLASGIFGASFLMSFLCWAAAGKFIPFTGLLQGALFLSVPLIFGAMAGVLSERSGVINIAIEGQLLAGAFMSGVLASLTQNKIADKDIWPASEKRQKLIALNGELYCSIASSSLISLISCRCQRSTSSDFR